MPVGLAVHALTTREHFGATWSRAAVCSSAWQLKRRADLLFETRARYSRGCGSKTSFGGEPGRAGRARARTTVAVREDQCGHDEPVHAIAGATQSSLRPGGLRSPRARAFGTRAGRRVWSQRLQTHGTIKRRACMGHDVEVLHCYSSARASERTL